MHLKVFWRFGGLEKGCIGNKWVNCPVSMWKVSNISNLQLTRDLPKHNFYFDYDRAIGLYFKDWSYSQQKVDVIYIYLIH